MEKNIFPNSLWSEKKMFSGNKTICMKWQSIYIQYATMERHRNMSWEYGLQNFYGIKSEKIDHFLKHFYEANKHHRIPSTKRIQKCSILIFWLSRYIFRRIAQHRLYSPHRTNKPEPPLVRISISMLLLRVGRKWCAEAMKKAISFLLAPKIIRHKKNKRQQTIT